MNTLRRIAPSQIAALIEAAGGRRCVVLENVKAGDLPEALRKRLKAGAEERLTVIIAKPPSRTNASKPRASKHPNASFGMWADRVHIDPAAYVRALRRPRHAR